MLYSIYINQVKAIEWDLTQNEAIILDWLTKRLAWFEKVTIGEKSWYWASRNLAIKEVPIVTTKPDTVYRIYKSLHEKGFIDYFKDGKKDLINLKAITKEWHVSSEHSEINPTKLGNKSEFYSEINPTNKNTIINIDDKLIDIDLDKKSNFKKWTLNDFENDIKLHRAAAPNLEKNDLLEFYNYWRELTPSGTMRFQIEKTWQTELRLIKWQKNKENYSKPEKPTLEQKTQNLRDNLIINA